MYPIYFDFAGEIFKVGEKGHEHRTTPHTQSISKKLFTADLTVFKHPSNGSWIQCFYKAHRGNPFKV